MDDGWLGRVQEAAAGDDVNQLQARVGERAWVCAAVSRCTEARYKATAVQGNCTSPLTVGATHQFVSDVAI